jgi:hypothetical protein
MRANKRGDGGMEVFGRGFRVITHVVARTSLRYGKFIIKLSLSRSLARSLSRALSQYLGVRISLALKS